MARCWRELCGWARAFTAAEGWLLLLEAALLALLVAGLSLLALHLLACGADTRTPTEPTRATRPRASTRCTAVGLDDVTGSSTPDASVDEVEYAFVLSLVRVQPGGVTFGCVLTTVTTLWAVTAASCVDAVEEVASLDAFVMMERSGRAVGVAGAAVHPGYATSGVDLAVLRAAERLAGPAAPIASSLEHARLVPGRRLLLLGFGPFRSVSAGGARRVRAAAVVRLPLAACGGAGGDAGGGGGGGGEPRHLRPAGDAGAGGAGERCGPAPLCAGVLFARGSPCQYCAGAALMVGGELLGVTGAAAGEGCGVACEPARAQRLAHHRAWLAAATADTDD